MPKRRTIYFDDARHFYLWNFEPPMDLHDAWVPVDQVAGTAVDTFIYGVARNDGLFYDTKASTMFGSNLDTFSTHYAWRAYQCLSSLVERGLSPLKVLIDRAHDKDMEFIASLRLGDYASMPKHWSTREGGQGRSNNKPTTRARVFSSSKTHYGLMSWNRSQQRSTRPPRRRPWMIYPIKTTRSSTSPSILLCFRSSTASCRTMWRFVRSRVHRQSPA